MGVGKGMERENHIWSLVFSICVKKKLVWFIVISRVIGLSCD